MKLLETAAVPLNLLLSRYEKVDKCYAIVIDAPMAAIRMIVESQARQDELEMATMEGPVTADKLFQDPLVKEEAMRMRAEWDKHGWDKELLRAITLGIFKVRGDFHPPGILVYSIPDEDYITVACRDVLLTADGYHRQLPVLRTRPFLHWPLRDHNSTDDKELPLKARGQERLPFALGLEVAEKNKALGTLALREKNYDDAIYSYGLAHLVSNRVTEEVTPEEHAEVLDLRLACYLNQAMCSLAQEAWLDAIDYCTRALEVDPNSVKALYRRAQANDAREEWDSTIEDLNRAAEAAVDQKDSAIPKLLAKAKKAKKAQAGEQQKLFSKMLSRD